jgi:hypothetical protein
MRISSVEPRRIAIFPALIALLLSVPCVLFAQDDDTSNQTVNEATLLPPEGATNTRAKGKAKTFYLDNGSNFIQRLNINAQHLQSGVEYQVLVDGVDYGLYTTRGNSGSLVLRFRDPARGSSIAFPEAEEGSVVDVREIVLIEIVDSETGEVVLSGSFEADDDGDGGDDGDGSGDDGDGSGDDGGSGGTGETGDDGGTGGGNGHGNGGGNGGGNGHGNGGGNGHGNGNAGGNGNGGGNGHGNGH